MAPVNLKSGSIRRVAEAGEGERSTDSAAAAKSVMPSASGRGVHLWAKPLDAFMEILRGADAKGARNASRSARERHSDPWAHAYLHGCVAVRDHGCASDAAVLDAGS